MKYNQGWVDPHWQPSDAVNAPPERGTWMTAHEVHAVLPGGDTALCDSEITVKDMGKPWQGGNQRCRACRDLVAGG